ncbi:MAG: MerR family transcriptional regulator [bacterium]
MTLLLTTYRTRTDFTLDELVAVTGDLLRETPLAQTRWKVTPVPDPRTIRYYLATGLLPKPLGYKGTAARFGYRHLLILLAIKTLQARFVPLKQIRDVVDPLDEPSLEALVLRAAPGHLLGWAPGDPAGPTSESPRARGRATGRRAGASESSGVLSAVAPQLPMAGLPGADVGPATWERLEIEPGLEIQVRADYAGAQGPSGVNAVLSKIQVLLTARQQRRANPAPDATPPTPRTR